MYRLGLDRFKKAESDEPFKVDGAQQAKLPPPPPLPPPTSAVAPPSTATTVGGGQSTWQAPEWATDPRPGIWYLEVLKDGTTVDRIALDRKRAIFGRQMIACDFVLDHPSLSRQHAAIVYHKNGSMFVVDLGSAHGTFVGQPPERLIKDMPVELEVGQSVRFAASTRVYILRREAPLPRLLPNSPSAPGGAPTDTLAPLPDPSDEAAVVAYNTALNRMGVESTGGGAMGVPSGGLGLGGKGKAGEGERQAKRARKGRVSFRDDYGGDLAHVFGVSDGADVGDVGPTPAGLKEGSSLVGKYESLVHTTIIPKAGAEPVKERVSPGASTTASAITQRLQQYLDRVKSPSKGGLYGGLLETSAPLAGGLWAASRSKDSTQTEGGSDARAEPPNAAEASSSHDQDPLPSNLSPRVPSQGLDNLHIQGGAGRRGEIEEEEGGDSIFGWTSEIGGSFTGVLSRQSQEERR